MIKDEVDKLSYSTKLTENDDKVEIKESVIEAFSDQRGLSILLATIVGILLFLIEKFILTATSSDKNEL